MTSSDWLAKYRRRLAGLAASLAIDCPTVSMGASDRAKAQEARGKRIETLETLGQDIDLTLAEMLDDARTIPPDPPKPPPVVRPEMRAPATNGATKPPIVPPQKTSANPARQP